MRILAEQTRCIVIDYQEKLIPAMAEKEQLIQKSVTLLKGLKEIGIPMMVTTQYAKGLGLNLPEIREAAGTEEYFDKKSFSAYGQPEVRLALEQDPERKNVIICGAETHICVLQTIVDLKEAGYQPILVTDCVSSRSLNDKEIGLKRAEMEGAILTTTEALLFELIQGATSPHFKQISALIK